MKSRRLPAACRLSPDEREREAEKYTRLHEGREPREFRCEPFRDPPASLPKVGQILAIQYRKTVTDGPYSYRHPYAKQARPSFGIDAHGKIWPFAGRAETRERGVEDRVLRGQKPSPYLARPYVQREHLPRGARRLTTLGPLERLEVQWYSGREGPATLAFRRSEAPTVAHDQNGNLYLLGGSYRIAAPHPGEKTTMAKRRSRRRRSHKRGHSRRNPIGLAAAGAALANPSRRRRGGGRRRGMRRNPSSRYNPSSRGGSFAMRAILGSLGVGAVAVATGIGEDMLLAMPFAAAISPTIKAGIKIVGSILLGAAVGGMIKGNAGAMIGSGIGLGGTVDGLKDLYDLYVAPRLAASSTTTTSTTTTTTAPGGYAMLPAGMPSVYSGYSAQNCGVRSR